MRKFNIISHSHNIIYIIYTTTIDEVHIFLLLREKIDELR